ncbi:hypothetical protein [Agromyces sp. GXQ0307]|uniref:hypothetical protein n=1 Tax=Agromyces sp. GXQ0307 TaxID=3377835 RepID=UPI00383AE23D
MSDGNRIAELQRLAYGAGTDDDAREAAADELHALRRAATRSGSNRPESPADVTGTPSTPAAAASAALDADPFDALGIAGDPPLEEPRRAASAALRWSVVVGAIALALGFGTGWIAGAQTTDLAGGSEGPIPDTALTFELERGEASDAAEPVPLAEARAMAVFERAQVPEDLPGFEDPTVDPATLRRVGTYPDGASIHVARSADSAQVCLLLDVREVGGMSTCTTDGLFPADGLYAEGGFETAFYRIEWAESGEVSFTARPTG